MATEQTATSDRKPRATGEPSTTFLSYDPSDSERVQTFVARHAGVLGRVRSVGVTAGDPVADAIDDQTIIGEVGRRYIGDAALAVVLLGRDTWTRRFVDWEIAAAAVGGCGLLALPVGPGEVTAPARLTLLAEEQQAIVVHRPPENSGELHAWALAAMALRVAGKRGTRAARLPLMRRDTPAIVPGH